MSATAVISAVSHQRLRSARSWLESHVAGEEVLIVGATLDAANELARVAAKTKSVAFGWHRLTLPQLAAAIATPVLAIRGLAPLSRIGTNAVAARLVHRLKKEGGLRRYEAVASTPGFPRAAANVLTELRMARLTSNAIDRVAPDLVPLMTAYEAELAAANLTDWPGILALATEAASAERAGRHRLIGLPTLLLDVSVATRAEFALVQALAAASPDFLATISSADGPTLKHIRDELGARVEAAAEAAVDGEHLHVGGSLASLQQNLFNEQERPSATESDKAVEVFSAPGEGRECMEIVRRVLSFARHGVPFDRMAVLLRSPDGYRANLEEAFDRAGIPVHFARGALRPDPAGRAFFSLLKCAAEGLSAQRFAEYLSLGQVPDATHDGVPPDATPREDRWVAPDWEISAQSPIEERDQQIAPERTTSEFPAREGVPVADGQIRAPWRWERLLVDAAVIGGRDRWQRRINGLANELRLKRAELAESDEPQAAAIARTLDDLTAFAQYTVPLIDVLDRLPDEASWGEWLDHLSALATRALKRPDRVLAVLSELAPIGPVGPTALSEVILVLEPLLLQAAVPPTPQRYGKVFAGPIEAARGLSFEAVFVPALAEKMFPRKIVEEPILLDAVRQELGEFLATNQTRLESERLALAIAVGAAERRICFSYPRLDLDQARPRVPSFYALEVVRAAEGVLPDFAALARRAETATAGRLGWPAPLQSADAIDDAEYDLTILDRILGRQEASPGAARYLVTINSYLGRALRARYQRWNRSWTAADGLTTRSDAVRAIMAQHTFGRRSYSPTALQNYARCPYRFFLQAIHGLAPRSVPEEIDELDPLQRGSLIHDIQFTLYARLQQRGCLPIAPSNLDQARHELEAIVTEIASRYHDDLAPAIERVWEDGIAGIRADLREWLRRMSEDTSGYVPWHFELSFGLERRPERRHADPQSVPGAIDLDCGIQLRGSIDLVERNSTGLIRVTDHKTGKVTGRQDQLIDGGQSLQPLLYALAAEKLFAGQAGVASGRLYFCTSKGGFAEQHVPLNDESRAAAVRVADVIGDAVAVPFLPAAPSKGQCDGCDFRVVCGPYEERRAARKPQGRLDPLLDLRESR